jgi:hypothetical protein
MRPRAGRRPRRRSVLRDRRPTPATPRLARAETPATSVCWRHRQRRGLPETSTRAAGQLRVERSGVARRPDRKRARARALASARRRPPAAHGRAPPRPGSRRDTARGKTAAIRRVPNVAAIPETAGGRRQPEGRPATQTTLAPALASDAHRQEKRARSAHDRRAPSRTPVPERLRSTPRRRGKRQPGTAGRNPRPGGENAAAARTADPARASSPRSEAGVAVAAVEGRGSRIMSAPDCARRASHPSRGRRLPAGRRRWICPRRGALVEHDRARAGLAGGGRPRSAGRRPRRAASRSSVSRSTWRGGGGARRPRAPPVSTTAHPHGRSPACAPVGLPSIATRHSKQMPIAQVLRGLAGDRRRRARSPRSRGPPRASRPGRRDRTAVDEGVTVSGIGVEEAVRRVGSGIDRAQPARRMKSYEARGAQRRGAPVPRVRRRRRGRESGTTDQRKLSGVAGRNPPGADRGQFAAPAPNSSPRRIAGADLPLLIASKPANSREDPSSIWPVARGCRLNATDSGEGVGARGIPAPRAGGGEAGMAVGDHQIVPCAARSRAPASGEARPRPRVDDRAGGVLSSLRVGARGRSRPPPRPRGATPRAGTRVRTTAAAGGYDASGTRRARQGRGADCLARELRLRQLLAATPRARYAPLRAKGSELDASAAIQSVPSGGPRGIRAARRDPPERRECSVRANCAGESSMTTTWPILTAVVPPPARLRDEAARGVPPPTARRRRRHRRCPPRRLRRRGPRQAVAKRIPQVEESVARPVTYA